MQTRIVEKLVTLLVLVEVATILVFVVLWRTPLYDLLASNVDLPLIFAQNLTVWSQIPDRRILIYPIAYEDLAWRQGSNQLIIRLLAAKHAHENISYICYGYVHDGSRNNIVKLGEAHDDMICYVQFSWYDAYYIECPCDSAVHCNANLPYQFELSSSVAKFFQVAYNYSNKFLSAAIYYIF